MTADAGHWLAAIDPVRVTISTRQCAMRAGEAKPRTRRMIKLRAAPHRSGMARLARSWKPQRRVARLGRGVVVALVARLTRRRFAGIDLVAVAGETRRRHVATGERKARRRVVETGAGPGGCCMARLARRREAGLNMTRIGRSASLRFVTARAGHRLPDKYVVRVAAGTRDRTVASGERKPCRRVIERRTGPRRGAMTSLARCGKARRAVRRRGRRIERRLMTTHAGGGSPGIHAVGVTRCTRRSDVLSCQPKSRGIVIKRRAIPRVERMTARAVRGELRGRMTR